MLAAGEKVFCLSNSRAFIGMQSSSKMQIGVFGIMVPVWKLWKRLIRVLHNISIVEFVVFEPRGCSIPCVTPAALSCAFA